jgi:RNA polymerase sigma-70 factor (ECF subfamily)
MFIPSFLSILNKQTDLTSEFKKNTLPHLDTLYNFALRMTGNENKAGKLVLETILRAFRFFSHLDEETHYRIWLLRVIKNAYDDLYGKLSLKQENLKEKDEEDLYEKIKDFNIDNSLLEKSVYKNISQNEIAQAIVTLPKDLKTVIVLQDLINFTDKETVYFTDAPLDVVRMRLHRARKSLFKKLSENVTFSEPEIQSLIKSLISLKLKLEPTPLHIRRKIVKKLT